MKRIITLTLTALCILGLFAGEKSVNEPTVYFTSEITPEALVRIYEALGVEPKGRVAVKISTGESSKSNHLRPELIKNLVDEVKGTLVECNTAYKGNRFSSEEHLKAIRERGYNEIAEVDLMDIDGSMDIPVSDKKWIKFNRVGKNLANYDFLVNLAHFKGHAMGGFGGVLKNQSIGIASREGKVIIHTAGRYDDTDNAFNNQDGQDAFLESMAAAAQSVHDYFKGNVIYINVMNNLSVDCDCDGHPHDPEMKDIGILASLDPVALDKACLDLVFHYPSTHGDDATALQERINRQHGTHIVDYAKQIGLGSLNYKLVDIDKK